MERDFAQSFEQESPEDFPRGADGVVRYPHLALSGGGANGAFGAGFLNGWSATGSRPVFKIVTGVSTGALMAPFAFLGPQYDAALHEFYTTTTTRDIFAIGSIAIDPDLAPARRFARRHRAARGADRAARRRRVPAQVADAHNRGRRLYIGTVDLDSQQFVVWNMGLIAASGRPEALDLFRKVMFASASVPIAFPPVFFEVEAGGRLYDEMHVDGAVAATVFLNVGVFRPSLIRERAGLGAGREDIFVIHNGQLSSDAEPDAAVPARDHRAGHRGLRPGGGGRGSLYHLWLRAARAGELSLGHHPRRRRNPRHRSLRPGEDERALRGRLPDRARGPRLVRGPSGTARGAFSALTGENASRCRTREL